ncbi:MAG TPA: GNAT family N-acetyltransferase [Steroidobacteraceae bacterium]|nr:GNAT family N-acetyltransferase [Steroidobacteraceae bacterium]
MTVDIRTATPADTATLVPLVEQYWKFEGIDGFDAKRVEALLGRLLADESLGRAWIASVGGRPVGYLLAVFLFSLEHGGQAAEIDEIFVRTEQRGSKVGAQLLKAAETTCRAAGCTKIALQLGRGNGAARRFYLKNGYSERVFDLLDKDLG